jgi:hypothetical protein
MVRKTNGAAKTEPKILDKKVLFKIADEFNEIMGLDPKIDTEQDLEKLQAEIVSMAKDELKPDDVLSKATRAALIELGCIEEAKEVAKAEPARRGKEKEPAPAEEKTEKKTEKRASAKAETKAAPKEKVARTKEPVEKSVYGHRANTAAGAIDKAISQLKKAKTLEEIAELSGCNKNRVASHVKHLVDKKLVKLTFGTDKEDHTTIALA